MDDEARAWDTVRAHLLRVCGVTLAPDQRYLMNARLEGVAVDRGYPSVAALVRAACTAPVNAAANEALLDAMTTHESFFFRDAQFWSVFEDEVVPNALTTRSGDVKIWCAACSHGQEPYSIAMVVQERWPDLFARLRIFGTDVSAPAVQRASAGIFSGLEVNRGLNANRVARHFEAVRGGFRVKAVLREHVTWSTHNLMGDAAPADNVAVAMCRNVLIYMNETERKKALGGICKAVAHDGYIGVGATETIWNTPSLRGWYRRNQAPTRL